MSNSSKPVNNNLENLIKSIRYTKGVYNQVKTMVDNTPLQIKILSIVIPFTLTYVFSYVYYFLPMSIIFAIVTTLIIQLMSQLSAFIFLILYIVIIINIANQQNVTIGKPILETDIVKHKTPYNCLNKSLTIANNMLEQDLIGGYFTYSFWLNINNDSNNSEGNWYNYRTNEWKSVFYRGNAIDDSGDLSSLVQFPGVWLTPVLNNMVIVFQNGSYVERLEINNIPFNTWTNYSIVVEAKSVSIYINGYLDRTLNLYQPVTIMNSYNLYLTSDINTSVPNAKGEKQSGFAGSLAELIFYNYALTAHDINRSYTFYKKIIDNYQNSLNKNTYSISGLITNSDYLD